MLVLASRLPGGASRLPGGASCFPGGAGRSGSASPDHHPQQSTGRPGVCRRSGNRRHARLDQLHLLRHSENSTSQGRLRNADSQAEVSRSVVSVHTHRLLLREPLAGENPGRTRSGLSAHPHAQRPQPRTPLARRGTASALPPRYCHTDSRVSGQRESRKPSIAQRHNTHPGRCTATSFRNTATSFRNTATGRHAPASAAVKNRDAPSRRPYSARSGPPARLACSAHRVSAPAARQARRSDPRSWPTSAAATVCSRAASIRPRASAVRPRAAAMMRMRDDQSVCQGRIRDRTSQAALAERDV